MANSLISGIFLNLKSVSAQCVAEGDWHADMHQFFNPFPTKKLAPDNECVVRSDSQRLGLEDAWRPWLARWGINMKNTQSMI